MGLKNVYIGQITEYGTDYYPTVTTFQKLYASGINNTTFTWEINTDSKEINADNETETSETVKNITGTFSMLGIDKAVKALLDNTTVDKNNNNIGTAITTNKPYFVIVYEYSNEKGDPIQMWLYHVSINTSRSMNHAQPSDQGDLSYDYTANCLPSTEVLYAEVFKGNPGFLTTAPTTVYKQEI